MSYAAKTNVSAEKSKAEIESTLRRYGAEAFGYATKSQAAMVEFQVGGKRIRFVVPMPDPKADRFRHDAAGRWRHPGARADRLAAQDHDQEVRRRWRALALVIKAKLEAVATEITTLEQEFLAHIVLPGGQTVGHMMIPRIDEAYKTGQVPALNWEEK